MHEMRKGPRPLCPSPVSASTVGPMRSLVSTRYGCMLLSQILMPTVILATHARNFYSASEVRSRRGASIQIHVYLTLPYLTLPYLTLPYLTLPYLTLPYLTLPYLTALTQKTYSVACFMHAVI